MRVSYVSSARAIISERLQNCLDCKIISPHGFVPIGPCTTPSSSIKPLFLKYLARRFGSVFWRETLLKIPRSPEPLLIRAIHSSISSVLEGFVSYTAELLATERCGSVRKNCPFLASRNSASSRSERLIIAVLLTPPATTHYPILQIMS